MLNQRQEAGLQATRALRRMEAQERSARSANASEGISSFGGQQAGLVPAIDVPEGQIAGPQRAVAPATGLMEVFVRICQRWRIPQERRPVLLGYPDAPRDASRIVNGHSPVNSQDVKDRVAYMLDISIGLGALYNDSEQAELTWLSHPRAAFGGVSAIEFMLQGKFLNILMVAQALTEERSP